MTPDHVHAVMRTMSRTMHHALHRITQGDTSIHAREIASLTNRGLITTDHTLTRLGRAVHKEHTK